MIYDQDDDDPCALFLFLQTLLLENIDLWCCLGGWSVDTKIDHV
jgi:hypothetical protein